MSLLSPIKSWLLHTDCQAWLARIIHPLTLVSIRIANCKQLVPRNWYKSIEAAEIMCKRETRSFHSSRRVVSEFQLGHIAPLNTSLLSFLITLPPYRR